MKLAYANAVYNPDGSVGGSAHIRQFVKQAVALGHEVWMWPWKPHPDARVLPASLVPRFLMLRQIDVVYTRVEAAPPVRGPGRWGLSPCKQLIGSPFVVWEFNTAPEYALVSGKSQDDVARAMDEFRRHRRDCDLAVCVSRALSEYVRDQLGIERVITVPNGSDPELFRPDVAPVRRVERRDDCLNVVWIGSANLPWQNFELLRDAAERLRKSDSRDNVAFHILGRGLERMRDMPPNVHYHGAEHYEQLPHWLSAMEVGLCLYRPGPSDFGSPVKLYDYMASGLAVVGTPQFQVREVFKQLDQLDLLVSPDDAEQLAAVLRQLAANRDRVRAQGQAGRKLVVDHYNWRRAVADTMREIESLKSARR